MKYLFVSASLYDLGGLAMVRGAMNGISKLDKEAEFASLHRPVHHREGVCQYFIEPEKGPGQSKGAFQWADVILDIGGLCTNQPNKYDWLRLRQKFSKPYVFMSQSFKEIDPDLLVGTFAIARGKNSADTLSVQGPDLFQYEIAPDLSFLIEPEEWTGKKYKRAFSTHIIKEIETMFNVVKEDQGVNIQVIWKPPTEQIWEPGLPIDRFHGTLEQNFGLIASVDEVHSARYHAAVAAVLAEKPLTIYGTKDEQYNLKYNDLLDYQGLSKKELRKRAMISCEIAVKVAKGE